MAILWVACVRVCVCARVCTCMRVCMCVCVVSLGVPGRLVRHISMPGCFWAPAAVKIAVCRDTRACNGGLESEATKNGWGAAERRDYTAQDESRQHCEISAGCAVRRTQYGRPGLRMARGPVHSEYPRPLSKTDGWQVFSVDHGPRPMGYHAETPSRCGLCASDGTIGTQGPINGPRQPW